MKHKPFRIIPLGGLGEIGRNLMVYQYGDEYLVVDAGLMFPENDMPGVDYIIPDFQFLRNKSSKVRGIVITHGHEDHIGAIQHLLPEVNAPVYATRLTRGLLEVKLARHGLASKAHLHTVQAKDTLQLGPFQVEFFHVSHSIPDAVGLGITTPAGLVVHTGDFKFDQTPVDNWPTDFARLAEFASQGVLALLSDSTNAERPGWTPSERAIDVAFDQVMRQAEARIIIATFASLISRMQQVVNIAQQYGRKLTFVGTSMVDNVKIARKLGYLEIPEALVVPIDQALSLPDRQVVLMCTGAQGEPTSILGRLSTGSNRQFDLKQGDTVVLSSHTIPGNEEAVNRTINRLFQQGAQVVYESIAPVHVSGHASQEELKLMINLVRPKNVIPIHGELRHLNQHAHLAAQVGIPPENIAVIENGQVIEFSGGKMQNMENVPAPYVFVSGSSVGDLHPDVMRERETLSRDGVVMVHVILDQETGRLKSVPEIRSHGYMLPDDFAGLMPGLRQRASQASSSKGNLEKEVQQAVRDYLYQETRRPPLVFVTVARV